MCQRVSKVGGVGAVILLSILYILLGLISILVLSNFWTGGCLVFGLGGLIFRLGDCGGDDGLVGAVFLVVLVDFVFFE